MGILDKFKKNKNQDDDDLDILDGLDLDEDGEEASGSSGGGAFGRAMGLLKMGKNQSSGGGDDDGEKKGGGLGGFLGKVKNIRGSKNASRDEDDEDSDDDEGDDQPIRRSGLAAALDGNGDDEESSEDAPLEIPVAGEMPGLGMDLEALFEEELVVNPIMKDLAESLDYVSAVELAANLRSFLEELE